MLSGEWGGVNGGGGGSGSAYGYDGGEFLVSQPPPHLPSAYP